MVFGRERYTLLWHWMMLGGSLTWLFHLVRGAFTNPLITFCIYVVLTRVMSKFLNPEYTIEETMLPYESYYDQDLYDSDY
jgi:hypothetical protein